MDIHIYEIVSIKNIKMYMFFGVGFKSINPTIANTITELLFLPIQNMLHNTRWETYQSTSRCYREILCACLITLFHVLKVELGNLGFQTHSKERRQVISNLRQIGLVLIIKSPSKNPLLDTALVLSNLKGFKNFEEIVNDPFLIERQISMQSRAILRKK